jgi:hypothetical protein
MSEPTGPHESLLVAGGTVRTQRAHAGATGLTISDLDLGLGVALGHILDAADDL